RVQEVTLQLLFGPRPAKQRRGQVLLEQAVLGIDAFGNDRVPRPKRLVAEATRAFLGRDGVDEGGQLSDERDDRLDRWRHGNRGRVGEQLPVVRWWVCGDGGYRGVEEVQE